MKHEQLNMSHELRNHGTWNRCWRVRAAPAAGLTPPLLRSWRREFECSCTTQGIPTRSNGMRLECTPCRSDIHASIGTAINQWRLNDKNILVRLSSRSGILQPLPVYSDVGSCKSECDDAHHKDGVILRRFNPCRQDMLIFFTRTAIAIRKWEW